MNANEIIIPCRLSYAHIWEPKSINGSEPKYSCCLLISKKEAKVLEKLKAKIEQVKKEGAAKWGGKIPPALKLPLRDGDEEKPGDDAYAGCCFLNANSARAPKVIDGRCEPILDADEVYSGCYANVKVSLFAFNANGNRGVAAGLVCIQKVRDGERLAGDSGADGFVTLADDEDMSYLD